MAGEEKQTLTPKEIIHEKFGVKARYRIEEVHISSPRKKTTQNGPCVYRCHLELPGFSVVSNVFKNREDSEHSAAELALEKLGIQTQDDDVITVDEAWDDIVERIKYIFSDEFLSADHPLGSHLRATLKRDGDRFGSVPVSVIATFDAKINSRCKVINPSVELDPILAMSYVVKAAAKLSDYIVVSPHVASLRRKNPYPPAIIGALPTHVKSIVAEAIYIQCTGDDEDVVEPDTLSISSGRYFLDVIAEKLGLKDGSQLIISRTIGKTYSGYECRVYSAIPKLNPSDKSSKAYGKRPVDDQSSHFKKCWNAKASSVCGQAIHGDAIVASVGYTRRSHDLEHDDVTLKLFYRLFYSTSPNGIYKFSRQAVIAAQLPVSFTTESNWRGPFPSEILHMFCRQHQLAEPVFTISTVPVKPLSDILSSYQKLKDSESNNNENPYPMRKKEKIPELEHGYRCEVKVLSKSQDLVLDCSLRNFYEKEDYAIQNASLKALSWFSGFFDDKDADPLHPDYEEEVVEMLFEQKIWMKETYPSSRINEQPRGTRNRYSSRSRTKSMPRERKYVRSIKKGSLVRISYSVYLKNDAEFSKTGKSLKALIEINEDIEFEVGNGSMNRDLELVVTQMSVGQCACFGTETPAEGLILAAAADTASTRSIFSEFIKGLEYRVHLLGVKEPTEERMEAATYFKRG